MPDAGIPWGTILASVGTTAALIGTGFSVLFAAYRSSVESHIKDANDRAKDANDRAYQSQERARDAEERTKTAERGREDMKAYFKSAVVVSRLSRRELEEKELGEPISMPPPDSEERTGQYYIELDHDRQAAFERERQRQRRLNPDADRKEQELRDHVERYNLEMDPGAPKRRR